MIKGSNSTGKSFITQIILFKVTSFKRFFLFKWKENHRGVKKRLLKIEKNGSDSSKRLFNTFFSLSEH